MNNWMQKSIVLGLLFAVSPTHAALSIFTCEPEWAALAREIGGDKVKVFSATSAAQDPHHIQARPSLIAKARRADLLICTGAGLEAGWLPLILRKARNSKIATGQPGNLMAADQVVLLDIPQVLDRSMGDIHAAGNPHLHLDPTNILVVAEVLKDRLSEIDAENTVVYEDQFGQFKQRWQTAMGRWQEQGTKLQGKSVVVYHSEWIYLLHWLGMERVGTLEPKPGVPPNAGYLATLKKRFQKTPASFIVRSSINDARPGDWLSAETGIPLIILPFTVGSTKESDSLQGLFDAILAKLQM